MHDPKKK